MYILSFSPSPKGFPYFPPRTPFFNGSARDNFVIDLRLDQHCCPCLQHFILYPHCQTISNGCKEEANKTISRWTINCLPSSSFCSYWKFRSPSANIQSLWRRGNDGMEGLGEVITSVVDEIFCHPIEIISIAIGWRSRSIWTSSLVPNGL